MPKLVLDSGIYIVGTVANRVLILMLTPVLARSLAPQEFGQFELLSVLVFLVAAIATAGIDSAVAILFMENRDGEAARVAGTGLVIVIAVSALLLLAAVAVTPWIAPWALLGKEHRLWLLISAVAVLPVAVSQYLTSLLKWTFRRWGFVIVTSAAGLTQLSLTWALVRYYDGGVTGALAGMIAGAGIGMVAAYAYVRGDCPLVFERRIARVLLRLGLPFLGRTSGVFASPFFERVIVARYLSLEQVAFYAVGARVAGVAGLFASGIQLAWGPIGLSRFRDERARRVYSNAAHVVGGIGCLLAVSIGLSAPVFIRILATTDYEPGAGVTGLLAFAFVAPPVLSIVVTPITALKRVNSLPWITWIGVAVFLVSARLLVSYVAGPGVAMASAIGAWLPVALGIWVSQRSYYVPYHLGWSVLVLGMTAALLLVASLPY